MLQYKNVGIHDSVVPVRVTTTRKWKQMDLLIYYSKGSENGGLVSQTQSQDNPARVSWKAQNEKSAYCNSVAESHCIIEA